MRFLLPLLLICIFAGTADAQRRSYRTTDDVPNPPTGITTEPGDSIQPLAVSFSEPPEASDLQSFLKETGLIQTEPVKPKAKPVPLREEVKEEEDRPTRRRGWRWRRRG